MNTQIAHPKKLVIFASGTGSNAKNIIEYFQSNPKVIVSHVFSNNRRAKVLQTALDLEVTALHFDRESFFNSNEVLHILKDIQPDLIILAGFLWLFPENIIAAFPQKIINLHPALLPKYGGKGMYGQHVHEAVLANKEQESGITFHYVNQAYDEGEIIAQFKTSISADENVASLTQKIRTLEHKHFPEVIENLLA